MAVAAGNQQVFAVGGDVEVPWMQAGTLIADFCQRAVLWVDTENGNTVFFQPVAGIEELTVRTDVYVGTASGSGGIGGNALQGGQSAVGIGKDGDFAGQFTDEIGMFAVRSKSQMSGTRIRLDGNGCGGG